MRMQLLFVAAALGCGSAYESGSLWRHGATELPHGTVGCLDVTFAVGYQRCPAAAGESECPRQPVGDLTFGNHCDREVTVDLAAIRFETRPDGQPLVIFDPESVIEAGVLDGRASGSERFELRGASGRQTHVCADLDGMSPGPERPVVCAPITLAMTAEAAAR